MTTTVRAGQEGEPPAEESQFGFARHLYQQGDSHRAVTELKRYLFLFPSGAKADEADYLLGEVYFQLKSFYEAIAHWEGLLKRKPQTPFKEEVQFKIGKALWELGREDEALSRWEKLALDSSSPSLKRSAARAVLWGLIKQKHYDTARRKLKQFALPASEQEIHETYILKAEQLALKSPTTAGVLAALLPGAGHLYLDRPQDALIAFGVNGLFAWGAISSFQQGNSGLGVLLSVIELAWYSGNIYSAVNTAHKNNRKQESDLLNNYGIRFGLFSSTPSSQGLYMAFHHAF
jgi:tetratricopeptide (TPR) repeat protein